MAWFHAIFAGREKILAKLLKPSTMRLSPKQNTTVVAFARSHYDRIGDLVVHQLTKNNIGRKTLVRNNEKQFNISFTYFICIYVTLLT